MEPLLVGMCIKIIRIFTVDNINRLKHVLECHYRPYGMRSIGCTMYPCRRKVMELLRELDPLGSQLRKKRRLRRRQYHSKVIFYLYTRIYL